MSPRFYTFRPKIVVFSEKKSSLEVSFRFHTFRPKIVVLSKKKKSLRFWSASHFSNFVPKQGCSLLSWKIMVSTQKFVGHATHDLHALIARHC